MKTGLLSLTLGVGFLVSSCGRVDVQLKEGEHLKKLPETTKRVDSLRNEDAADVKIAEIVSQSPHVSEDSHETALRLVSQQVSLRDQPQSLSEMAIHLNTADQLVFWGDRVTLTSMINAIGKITKMQTDLKLPVAALASLGASGGRTQLPIDRPIFVYSRVFEIADGEQLLSDGHDIVIVAEEAILNGKISTSPLLQTDPDNLDAGNLHLFAKTVKVGANFELNLSGATYAIDKVPVVFGELEDNVKERFVRELLLDENANIEFESYDPGLRISPDVFVPLSDHARSPLYLAFVDAVQNRIETNANRTGIPSQSLKLIGKRPNLRLDPGALVSFFEGGQWGAGPNGNFSIMPSINQNGPTYPIDIEYVAIAKGIFPKGFDFQPPEVTVKVEGIVPRLHVVEKVFQYEIPRPRVTMTSPQVTGGRAGRLAWIQGTSSRLDFRYFADEGAACPEVVERPVRFTSGSKGDKSVVLHGKVGALDLSGSLEVGALVHIRGLRTDNKYGGHFVQKYPWTIVLREGSDPSSLNQASIEADASAQLPTSSSMSRTELQAWGSGYAGQWQLLWSEIESKNLPYFDPTQPPFSTFKTLSDLHKVSSK